MKRIDCIAGKPRHKFYNGKCEYCDVSQKTIRAIQVASKKKLAGELAAFSTGRKK